jgi:hypothetical protein
VSNSGAVAGKLVEVTAETVLFLGKTAVTGQTSRRRGRERAELVGMGKGRSRELCEPLEFDPLAFAGRSLPFLHQQPQQASCRDDQHNDDAPRR